MAVMAVIALISFVSYPAFDAWFQAQRLYEGVDQVRTHWIKARTQAMEEGQPYRFAYEAGGRHYRIAPDDMEHWPELTGAANGPTIGVSGIGALFLEEQLPENVHFGGEGGAGGGWSSDTIVFQPDGSAQLMTPDGQERPEVTILFGDKSKQVRALRIRAMTGVVSLEYVKAP
jgi:hypothetical protein